jgi:integration host factor subunit alpha
MIFIIYAYQGDETLGRYEKNFPLTLKLLSSIVCAVEEVCMTKADIISEVFDKVGLPKQDAEELVEMILDMIKQTLKEGETVKLSGFGNFVVRKKNSRKGRNPKTGQEIEITPRKVVSFRPSMIFKEHVIESPTTTTTE